MQKKKKSLKEKEKTEISISDYIIRIGETLWKPENIFEKINKDKDWYLPAFLIGTLIILITLSYMIPYLNPIREGYFLTEETPTPKSVFQNKFLAGIFTSAIYYGIIWLFKTFFFWSLIKLFNQNLKFMKLFSLIGYCWIPLYIKQNLLIISSHLNLKFLAQIVTAPNMLPLSLTLNQKLSNLIKYGILPNLDIFIIWSFILIAIGLNHFTKIGIKNALFIVFVFWLLTVLSSYIFLPLTQSVMG